MRIALMGSGGLGGYFGARLAQGGADVHFIARGAHLAALQARGLAIDGPNGIERVAPVSATADPALIATRGPVDLVLFAVKLWDTADAIEQIRPLVGPQTMIVSFQNGVLKDDALRAAFGQEQIIGGVGYVATHISEPGVIKQTGPMQRLQFGEFNGARSARVERFLAACLAGKINAEISADIRRTIWEKFVFLVGLSGTTATIRKPIGPIRTDKQTRQFLLDIMREVVAVGRALGVDLPADYAEQRLKLADDVDPNMTASLLHDLERGNRLEVRWLAGAVVELGGKLGVPTPLNRAVADILLLHAHGTQHDR